MKAVQDGRASVVGIVGSVNGVGNSRISFCRLTFCIIRIDLFTSVHGSRRCLRISSNKGGKNGLVGKRERKKKREAILRGARDDVAVTAAAKAAFFREKEKSRNVRVRKCGGGEEEG